MSGRRPGRDERLGVVTREDSLREFRPVKSGSFAVKVGLDQDQVALSWVAEEWVKRRGSRLGGEFQMTTKKKTATTKKTAWLSPS